MAMTRSVLGALFLALVVGLVWAPALTAAPATGSVQGKVTLFGKPLAAGKLWFHPAKGKPVVATVKNGAYSAAKVPVGELRITLEGKGVPKKYAAVKTTPLTLTVQKGENNCDLVVN